MEKTTVSATLLVALLGLSCCTFNRTPKETPAPSYDASAQALCPGGVCETDPFINYTTTRAEYRQYGELSPRDHLVSQAAAGNNLSAAVPPSIDDEVISYEAQVETQNAADATPQVQEVVELEDKAPVDINNKPSEQAPSQAQNEAPAPISAPVADETAQAPVEEPAEQEQIVSVQETVENVPQEEPQTDEYGEDAVRDWYAEEGQNLKALLTEWSEQSGWRLVWNSNRNYVLNAGAMFRGRFADVSSALIRAFARARPAPVATFYKGNRVLVVETMEDENAFD